MMLSLILWVLAPVFNAIMDRVENESIINSIFSKLNPNFWYKRQTAQTMKQWRGYRFDAWHISKSIMIILVASSASVAIYYQSYLHITNHRFINWGIDMIIRGISWNLIFDLFYHRIFKLKTK